MATQTGMANITDGDRLDEGYFNEVGLETMNMALSNHIKQLINRTGIYSADGVDLVGDAYIDATGRNNYVDEEESTAVFDTNKYKAMSISQPFVIIEATSISSVSDFAINDCKISLISTGTWRLECTVGTDAVRRAQIYKTLFYGTTGADPRAEATYLTTVTAMKTTVTRDVGKRGHYGRWSITGEPSSFTYSYTGTFADTTTNTDCSAWTYCWVQYVTSTGTVSSVAYFPGGTVVNSVSGTSGDGPKTSDETGTDVEGDEVDNPATTILTMTNSSTATGNYTIRTYFLAVGTVSWVADVDWPKAATDFLVDNNIPVFTLATETYSNIITHSITSGTFSSTIGSAIGNTVIVEWEDGGSIQYKLINTSSDTGWLDTGEISNFEAFSSEPTTSIVRLVPKTSSPTEGYPSIKGFAVRAV